MIGVELKQGNIPRENLKGASTISKNAPGVAFIVFRVS